MSNKNEFSMPLTQKAYDKYAKMADTVNIDSIEEAKKFEEAAIHLLSCICHDYLCRDHGDFIRIEMSDEWQR